MEATAAQRERPRAPLRSDRCGHSALELLGRVAQAVTKDLGDLLEQRQVRDQRRRDLDDRLGAIRVLRGGCR